MAARILVPFDGSPQAKRAIEYALETFPDGEIVALTVIDPAETGYVTGEEYFPEDESWYEDAREEAEHVLDDAREICGDRGIECQHVIGRPERAIVEYVEDHDLDHVVMGSHGRTGVARLLLGSVAEQVMRRSPVPVTVVR